MRSAKRFRDFQRRRLQRMGAQIVAFLFPLLGEFPNALSGGHDQETDIIHLAAVHASFRKSARHKYGSTLLARERERLDDSRMILRIINDDIVARWIAPGKSDTCRAPAIIAASLAS